MAALPCKGSAPVVHLTTSTVTAHSKQFNGLDSCGKGRSYWHRVNRWSGESESKVVWLSCGKATCPRCQRRRRLRLVRRIQHVQWSGKVRLWTVTIDPKVLTQEEANRTMSRRWHVIHRSLLRLAPRLKYVRVLEYQQSGMPHYHFLVDVYLPWKEFQNLLTSHGLGEVLQFETVDAHRVGHYVAKYLGKGVSITQRCAPGRVRLVSGSRYFLPVLRIHDADGEWALVWVEFPNDGSFATDGICPVVWCDRAPPMENAAGVGLFA